MHTRDSMLARLRSSPLYKAALASVDDEQAKRISAYVESWLMQAVDGLVPVMQQVANPQMAQQPVASNEQQVITSQDQSGSKGE